VALLPRRSDDWSELNRDVMTMISRQFPLRLLVAAVFAWTAGLPAFADDPTSNKAELIRSLLPTVVNISVAKEESATPSPPATVDSAVPKVDAAPSVKSFVGSGFIIDPSGLIVTNYHVVQDAFEIMVTLSDGTRLSGKMLSASRLADLALVQVETTRPLSAAHWGNSDSLHVGDQVLAVGNPFGIGLSVSAGIVSGLNRDIQDSPYDDLIQTDATINHGNSGGPLFDMQGNVVGVDSAIISPTTGSVGLGFAIPASSARFVIDRLRTYGWVRPAWIGVKVQTVTRDIADAIGMQQPEGAIVSWVLPNGPAEKAGLTIGDVILRYNGSTPSDDRALLRYISQTPVGETMTLLVRHEGDEHNVAIPAMDWPRNQWDARDAPTVPLRPKTAVPPDLGLAVAAIGPDDRTKLGLETGLAGVLVANVAPNSDAGRRGMVTGDIILRVRDKPVATPADVQSNLDAARAGKRDFVLLLVLPKVRPVPGPKWVALRLGSDGG
jgi:serine protease Do